MKGLIQGQYGAYGLWYAIIFIVNATTPQIIPGIMFFINIPIKTNGDIDRTIKLKISPKSVSTYKKNHKNRIVPFKPIFAKIKHWNIKNEKEKNHITF